MKFAICTFLLIVLPLAAGPVAYKIGKKNRKNGWSFTLLVLLAELLVPLALVGQTGAALTLPGVCGMGLNFSASGLQVWLCILAGFLWLMSGLFSGKYFERDPKQRRYTMFLLLTEGAIMGVFLSADLFTTLVFFEMMSFASWPLVAHRETRKAVRAGNSYLAYAVIGGMVSLMGLFLLWNRCGTLRYDELGELAASGAAGYWGTGLYVAGLLALTTFAAKVCMFPLHTWLPGSYSEAPSPATALLSGIITKAGVFGIFGLTAKVFCHSALWGNIILLCGIATALVGGTLALLNANLKETVAYSSMSQIGFILVGTGMTALLGEEGGLAVWGSILHLTNHSLIKLVLLLTAGVIVFHAGELSYDTIRGFGRGKPALAFAFLMPALGVMGVPLWNGYISKTLIHEAIVEYIEHLEEAGGGLLPLTLYQAIEWLFLIAGGMTVAYMTKLFVCIFVEENTDSTVQEKYNSLDSNCGCRLWLILLDGCAAVLPVLGLLPHLTQDRIAAYGAGFFGVSPERTVAYFSLTNAKGAAISLAIGAVLYLVVVRGAVRTKDGYRGRWPEALNLEQQLYQPLLFRVLPFVGAFFARTAGSLFEWLTALGNRILFFRWNKYVTPKEAPLFARYEKDVKGVRGYRGRMAYGLALFGVGFAAVMVYLLAANFLL